jgi:cyanophycin synthetase
MPIHVTQLSAPELVSYRHGLRQPAQTIHLRIGPLVAGVNWPQVDEWLEKHLGVTPLACPPLPGSACRADEALVPLPWFWRILLTAAALLRFGGVPFFEPGKLLNVALDPSTPQSWLAEAVIAQVDYIPSQHTVQAFEAAAIVVCGLAARPDDFAQAESLFQQLESKIIGPMWTDSRSSHSTLGLLEAAYLSHIPWRHQGNGIYQLGWGVRQQRLQGSQLEGDSLIGQHVAQNKSVTCQWLRDAGLPVPEHVLVNDAEAALRAVQTLGGNVVIKPAVSVGGQGVTLRPRGDSAVRAAFLTASQSGGAVLVEQWVAGSTHFVHVVGGQVQRVLRRDAVAVQGDGRYTVAQLVAAENGRRQQSVFWRRPLSLPLDAKALQCLAQAGLRPDSVPDIGVWAPLREIPTNEDGGRDEDLTHLIHRDNVRIALAAVRRLGLATAGVDILSHDISQPWHRNGAMIHEVNHAPDLGLSPVDGRVVSAMLAGCGPTQGRIPVEVIVGDACALDQARQRQRQWLARGVPCFISSHETTEGPQGPMPLAFQGTFLRARALLMDAQVGALVLVLQTDEWCSTGLPVDQISRLEVTPGPLRDHRTLEPLTPQATAALTALLQAHLTHETAGDGLA